jgi:uncharacterized protein YjeT (DUF2065 family)
MEDFITAVGLVLVLEGALYALFPEGMKRMMEQALAMSPTFLRKTGLVVAIAGFFIVWLMRG